MKVLKTQALKSEHPLRRKLCRVCTVQAWVFSQNCFICRKLQLLNPVEFWFTTKRGKFGSLKTKKNYIHYRLTTRALTKNHTQLGTGTCTCIGFLPGNQKYTYGTIWLRTVRLLLDGTETSDNSTLSTRVLHCAHRSLPHSVLFVQVSHSLATGNAAFDTALPVIFRMSPRLVTDCNF